MKHHFTEIGTAEGRPSTYSFTTSSPLSILRDQRDRMVREKEDARLAKIEQHEIEALRKEIRAMGGKPEA